MVRQWVFVIALELGAVVAAPRAFADVCSDGRHSCDDTGAPECWYNPSRQEYACSPRGWNHCASASLSYSCQPPGNCYGDGSTEPRCTSPSSDLRSPRPPKLTPASLLGLAPRRLLHSVAPQSGR